MKEVEQTAKEVGADKADNGEDQANKEGLAEDARVLEVRENQHVGADRHPEAYQYVRGGFEEGSALGLSQACTLWRTASSSSLREEPTMRPGAALLREAFWAKLHLRLSLAILALMV